MVSFYLFLAGLVDHERLELVRLSIILTSFPALISQILERKAGSHSYRHARVLLYFTSTSFDYALLSFGCVARSPLIIDISVRQVPQVDATVVPAHRFKVVHAATVLKLSVVTAI